MRFNMVKQFLKLEAKGGIILFVAALMALIMCNSPWQHAYQELLLTPFAVRVGNYSIVEPFLFWINEGLMSLFFLSVGLELKREFVEGELSKISQIILPGIAALGGMLFPAILYSLINSHDATNLKAWAVPVATDIAFALGVLSLFGKKVPKGLKIFLLSLAIFDDVGAILIIAIFHTASLSYLSLLAGLFFILILEIFNRLNIVRLSPYIIVGLILWFCVLESGVHATVAGVLLAFMIPMEPVKRLERTLTPWVVYLIMPLFAFANAGLALDGLNGEILGSEIVIGIVAGLFLGKQIGVFGFSWLVIHFGWAKMPENTSWAALYGVAILCGIGFTMSLFLGTLAFEGNPASYLVKVRLGVLLGSLLSGLIGALVLHLSFSKNEGYRLERSN